MNSSAGKKKPNKEGPKKILKQFTNIKSSHYLYRTDRLSTSCCVCYVLLNINAYYHRNQEDKPTRDPNHTNPIHAVIL